MPRGSVVGGALIGSDTAGRATLDHRGMGVGVFTEITPWRDSRVSGSSIRPSWSRSYWVAMAWNCRRTAVVLLGQVYENFVPFDFPM